jgi:NAD(P)H-dependent flavin oxidoreductase YrpB (nitropropane dioxygenase family)
VIRETSLVCALWLVLAAVIPLNAQTMSYADAIDRLAAAQANDAARMQAWAGQSARLARAEPTGEVVRRLWQETQALLG